MTVKKVLALMLCLCMIAGTMSTTAFAVDEEAFVVMPEMEIEEVEEEDLQADVEEVEFIEEEEVSLQGDEVELYAATELYVSSDYNSSTEGYGVTKFNNYAGAYAYATANAKTATIVIEKTTTLSGNTFDNNHKTYSKLAVVIKDGATMGNALSKWDMTYPVTVEAGGTITCARPASASVSNVHIKNTLTIGTAGSDKKAYCYLLSDSYQDCDISIRWNGKVVLNNAVMTVQDLDAQGSFTATNSEITVDGAFASDTAYATTLTDSTMTVKGTQISGGLADFAEEAYAQLGNEYNQLGKVTLNDSAITFGKGSKVIVATSVTANGDSAINADELIVNNKKKITVNDTSSVSADTLTNNGTIVAESTAMVTAEEVSEESTGSATVDGKTAAFNGTGSLVPVVAKVENTYYETLAEAVTETEEGGKFHY